MTEIKYSILPIFLFSALISSDCLAQPPCKKFYLVIDGSDSELFSAWRGKPYVGAASARYAASIAKWLEGKGFKGETFGPTAHPRDKKLQLLIESYGRRLKCPPGSQCCHELFIYIVAHGKKDWFTLYDENGTRGIIVTYAKLASWLRKLPRCVKLTIFIEACYSGGAIKHLKPPLCKRFSRCGVTIMTTTDEGHETPAGEYEGAPSSRTQDFMKGADKDNDDDGDKGDIRDRWLEMEKTRKAEEYGVPPPPHMCEGQTRMCSLENVKDTVEKPGILPLPPTGVLRGKPSAVSVPGDYVGTPIEDMAVTTGPEKAPAVPSPATAPGGLEPVLKTDDTVIAAGQLDNSAMGSNAISVIDKNTGKVLGQTQIDMWRLAGARLDPPVVNKGQDTNLRLDFFGPPDLQLEVTATAGEGLTPKQLTATAPIGVLQSQGLGAFTATKAGTHSVSVKAQPIIEGKEPVMGLPAWR